MEVEEEGHTCYTGKSSELATEVNREEWVCIFCQKAVEENMMFWHYKKWAQEPFVGNCKKNSDAVVIFFHAKVLLRPHPPFCPSSMISRIQHVVLQFH
jgi:hypothetical protein